MKNTGMVKGLLIAGLMAGMALPSMAVLTLPIADDAVTDAGLMRLGAGVTLESDINLYGGRFTYGLADGIGLFGGGGIVDPDGPDSEPYFQVGGQYTLPVYDLPFDLAVRGAFGMTSFDESSYGWETEIDIWMLNFGLLASTDVEMVTLYGYAGLSYQDYDYERTQTVTVNGTRFRQSISDDNTETELAIGGGVLFPVNDQISFYGELMHIDDLFISLGGHLNF